MSRKPCDLKLNPGQRYAVLTGDVVESSKLGEAARRELPVALEKASRAARALYGKAVPLDADVFRGDSWQLVVTDAKLGLRVAVFFRAHLHGNAPGVGLDTRIAIGIGTINFVPKGRVSQGDGPAFRESGKVLERMPKNRRLGLSVAETETPAGIAPVIGLMDTVMERWTEKQSLAVAGMLQGLPQSQIAELWNPPVKQPVVARHLRQAGWEAVEAGLTYVENTLD
ncbi:MAG TPA: hypothetical protein VFD66_00345, partial [Verrucomicrobiae bacterium]|nr:hypothetical protein [Verrucomicrobiae bacterium]